MTTSSLDIMRQLEKSILPLQGYKTSLQTTKLDLSLGPIDAAFPHQQFPLGAIHEFIHDHVHDLAASTGFIAGILPALMQQAGAVIWISTSRLLFPPALTSFGVKPDQFIFIDLQKEKDILWVMEEALKCEGLAAVVGELSDLNFTSSRRLQLAVEQSRVTGFVLRKPMRFISPTACLSRWKITSLPSQLPGSMPGVGFPRWNVSLLKIRNGHPGSWPIEFRAGRFYPVSSPASIVLEQRKKTG